MATDDRERTRLDPFAFAGSLAATTLRFGAGIATTPRAERPKWLFELYEFEGCPYCRIVREVLTELDLDAEIRPCPKGGTRFRPRLLELGGKEQFPYLVDPSTGTALYESADIIAYLFETYGGGRVPLRWRASALQQLGSSLAGMSRPLGGRRVRPSRTPSLLLELYSFEGSPYARLVRERLCELELPYVLRSVGRSTLTDWVPPAVRSAFGIEPKPATVNRRDLLNRSGRISVPYLVDPNFGVQMGESADIIDYLECTYAL